MYAATTTRACDKSGAAGKEASRRKSSAREERAEERQGLEKGHRSGFLCVSGSPVYNSVTTNQPSIHEHRVVRRVQEKFPRFSSGGPFSGPTGSWGSSRTSKWGKVSSPGRCHARSLALHPLSSPRALSLVGVASSCLCLFFVPFSAISAPVGLKASDSSTRQGETGAQVGAPSSSTPWGGSMAAAPTPEDQRCPCTSEHKHGGRRAEGPPAATQCGRHGAATWKVARWRCWGTPVELSAATAPSKGQRRLRTERAKGLARSGAAATRCVPEACWRAPAGVRAGRLTFGCVYWRAKRAGSSLPKNPVNPGLRRPNTAPPRAKTPLSKTQQPIMYLYGRHSTRIL